MGISVQCCGGLLMLCWPQKKSMYCIPSHAKAISKRSTTNSVWCSGVFGNNSSCPPCTRWTGIGQYIAHPYDADEFAYPHVYRQTRTNEIQCQMFHVGGCHELTSNRCQLRPPETIFCFMQKDWCLATQAIIKKNQKGKWSHMFAWGMDTFATIQHPIEGGMKNWELEYVFWRTSLYIDAHGQCGQEQGYKDLCYILHVWHPGLHFFSDLQFFAFFFWNPDGFPSCNTPNRPHNMNFIRDLLWEIYCWFTFFSGICSRGPSGSVRLI